tara:strand:+ start:945 stop:1184 length:240 start_codon:yes stop_codon:yes gene_type:complete
VFTLGDLNCPVTAPFGRSGRWCWAFEALAAAGPLGAFAGGVSVARVMRNPYSAFDVSTMDGIGAACDVVPFVFAVAGAA